MSLYRCTKCDVIENTATGEYWQQHLEAHETDQRFEPKCSKCLTGTWHGQFPRQGVTPDWLQDARGFLWRPHQTEGREHLGPFTPVAI